MSDYYFVDGKDNPPAQKPELFMPVNLLKQKVGSGGIDEARIEKAQTLIQNVSNDIFKELINELLSILQTLIALCRHEQYHNTEKLIEDYAATFVQIKAHGAMFRYPLMSSIANNAVRFLDNVNDVDEKTLDVLQAHCDAIHLVKSKKMEGDGGEKGEQIKKALAEACKRYFNIKKK
jgi:hypothetical protein